MKIYKTKIRGFVFCPYLRDNDEMDNLNDPKPTMDNKQIFKHIAAGVEGNIAQSMRSMAIGKRPQESFKVGTKNVEIMEKVEKLEDKVDNLEYVVGLVYKMLKAKG